MALSPITILRTLENRFLHLRLTAAPVQLYKDPESMERGRLCWCLTPHLLHLDPAAFPRKFTHDAFIISTHESGLMLRAFRLNLPKADSKKVMGMVLTSPDHVRAYIQRLDMALKQWSVLPEQNKGT